LSGKSWRAICAFTRRRRREEEEEKGGGRRESGVCVREGGRLKAPFSRRHIHALPFLLFGCGSRGREREGERERREMR
jgi:hypothetical protein